MLFLSSCLGDTVDADFFFISFVSIFPLTFLSRKLGRRSMRRKWTLVNCPKINESSLTSAPTALPRNTHFKIFVLFFKTGFPALYTLQVVSTTQLVVNMWYFDHVPAGDRVKYVEYQSSTFFNGARESRRDTLSWIDRVHIAPRDSCCE